jgi:hypothetical protein
MSTLKNNQLVTLITDIDVSVILSSYGVKAQPRYERNRILYRNVPYTVAKQIKDALSGHLVKIRYRRNKDGKY